MNDETAIAELASVSDLSLPHSIVHYLYLPNLESARRVALVLKERGFITECRESMYDNNWLVLAAADVVPSLKLSTSTRELMQRLAESLCGEYDGWEAKVVEP